MALTGEDVGHFPMLHCETLASPGSIWKEQDGRDWITYQSCLLVNDLIQLVWDCGDSTGGLGS